MCQGAWEVPESRSWQLAGNGDESGHVRSTKGWAEELGLGRTAMRQSVR